ncbi:hypothetical protein ACNQ6O_10250 [Marinobacter sp. SBS5]|uniref:hypothetical protein n=1 Tax=Marinobacter sp. SBS5 TaxID=3401754 RepID=UPI003AAF2028
MLDSPYCEPRNELTHPAVPVSGRTLTNLKLVLESVVGQGEVRDLDLAMLLNVPINRLGKLKKAKTPAEALQTLGSEDEQDSVGTIRPNHAILVRLLLKHPEYAPLPRRPGNAALYELLAPLLPEAKEGGAVASKQGFAPLFGRSSVSPSWPFIRRIASNELRFCGRSAKLPVLRTQVSGGF